MSAPNIETSTSYTTLGGDVSGVRLGLSITEALGFYGAQGVTQPTASAVTTGFTAATGTAVLAGSTFTGNVGSTAYTIGDVVAALKNLGLIKS